MKMCINHLASALIFGSLVFTACNFTYKIKNGQEAFEVKQYAVAVEMLSEEYEQTNNLQLKARKAFMTGLSYENMHRPDDALIWFKRAWEHNFGTPALEKYAHTLKQLERYDLAAEAYRQLMEQEDGALKYRQEMTACQQAMQWKEQQEASPYIIQSMNFNSPASEFGPYVLGPEMILFTSDRSQGAGDAVYKWTGRAYTDLYVVNTASNTIQPFDPVVNSEHNDGTVAFNSDRTEMYFTRCEGGDAYDMYCKLMMCTKRGASWSEPEVLSFVKEEVNYGHPVLAENDSILVFSSNDPEGAGGYDLYFSVRTDDGWSTPAMISNRINTIGNEKFPSMFKDTLYFSSDYHVGMGGLDIFKSYLTATGEWTPPFNLKPPVNSGWDDFGFVVDTFLPLRSGVLQQGYFTSARDGSDDIYRFQRIVPAVPEASEPVVSEEEEEEEKINYQIFLAIRVMEPLFADPDDPNSERIGKRPLGRARVSIGNDEDVQALRTDGKGYLVLELEWEEVYNIRAQFRGFLSQRREFSTVDLEKDPGQPVQTHNMEIVLEPVFKGKEIVLDNIYYDYDKWFIREDAKPALDTLTKMLKDNPAVRIQLGSHTDCRGEHEYNLDLSQKRAQSAVDYLISQGIAAGRLVATGYGETRLAVDCVCEQCTEEQHQENRRTTFTVIE